ncbi:MAG: ABC transporter permease [Candidatus Heimdallarchaeaceae archaeon]
MEVQDTKRVRKIMIYWLLSSILFIVDAIYVALPAYRNPTTNRILPHLQLGIETPILVNQNYLVWGIMNFIGLASIICLVIVILRPQKSKDIYFVGLIPFVISIISLSFGAARFWGILTLIFNLMIVLNALNLTGRMKQGFSIINRTIFQNEKIVTGAIWSITTVALLLDAILRAFPESQVEGIQLFRGIMDCVGAASILLAFLLFNKSISKRIKFWIGIIPFASTMIGFLGGFPGSMTSIWMWVAIVFSIANLVSFANLFGEVKDLILFNKKLHFLLWSLASIMAVINALKVVFPLYSVQQKTVQLSWGIIDIIFAASVVVPVLIHYFKPKKWVVIVTGFIPLFLGVTDLILGIKAEKTEIWTWFSLILGLFATLFAFLTVGNPNNQQRSLKKWKRTWGVFKQNWMGVSGLILLTAIVVLAIGGSRLTKWDPDSYGESGALEAPSVTHILGTNRYGQDVFTVLLDSLSISLLIGIIAGSLTVILGTTIGVASAYLGGWIDTFIMRITDVVLVMPALPLMLVLASLPFLFGQVHWSVIAVVYIVVFWPVSARLIRGQALSIKERAFVTSAKSSGAGSRYIIFKHVLPNVFPLMLTMIITSMRQAILYESFLAYLGLGDPLNWTLGQMLYIAQQQAALSSGAWWMFFPPGLAIGLITLSFAFIGMALDEIVNPRLRKR